MDIGYGTDQSAGVFVRRRRRFAPRGWHRFQHLPHNLRLQLWDLCLKSLRHGMFDALPRLVLFLVLVAVVMRHA
jgi:hypothetical protein